MNVIQHGKNYREITCPACGCIFGYIRSGIKCELKARWDPVAEKNIFYVICPECAEFVDEINNK